MTNYLQQEQRKIIIECIVLSILALGGAFALSAVLAKESSHSGECEEAVVTPQKEEEND